MKKSSLVLAALVLAAGSVSAQDVDPAAARAAYQQQQALAEVPRLIQQFDLLVQNQDAIVTRLQRLEQAAGPDADMQAEIAALKAEIAELKASVRREQDAMRREIVADLAQRISKMTPPAPPPPPPAPVVAAPARTTSAPARATPPPAPASVGPHYEYVVEKGQTLSLIAQGFDTTVSKILAANPGLKPNALRVGQKLIIPAEDQPKGGKKSRR